MAQLPCIGLGKPCVNLPFGDNLTMYFDHGVSDIKTSQQGLWDTFMLYPLQARLPGLRHAIEFNERLSFPKTPAACVPGRQV